MKKGILIMVVASASLFSCAKDRTCTCTTTYSTGGVSSTSTVTLVESTKGQAKANCVSTTQTNATTNITTTNDCKLD